MPLSQYAVRRLAHAKGMTFGYPVTAYLTNARIVARSGVGVVHHHISAESSGRFSDGNRIRTSDVMRVERVGEYWLLHTLSGSLYVIVTFDRLGGRHSLNEFNALGRAELHFTPPRLQ